MYIVKRISIAALSIILTGGIVFGVLQAQTTHAFNLKQSLCSIVGADCSHHSKAKEAILGANSHGSIDILKKEGEIFVSGIINSDLAKERIFKHKHTNKTYPYSMFEKIGGKVYLNKATGKYISENQLQEVRGTTGYYNAVDDEIVVAKDFDESVEHIFRNDKIKYYATSDQHMNYLEDMVKRLKEKLEKEKKRVGIRY